MPMQVELKAMVEHRLYGLLRRAEQNATVVIIRV
jgi:hypothetical protein